MKTKRFYRVSYITPITLVPNGQTLSRFNVLEHTVKANSPYHAAILSFKQWIRNKSIKRQPKGDDAGGFLGVEVEIL